MGLTNHTKRNNHRIVRQGIWNGPVRGRRSRGFTLLEALITLAIAAFLSLMLPDLRNLLLNSRMTTQINGLVHDMHLARSEAITQGTQVILCKSRSQQRCSRQSRWDEGWILFSDVDHDEALDDDEPVLLRQGRLNPQTRLHYAGFRSHHFVTFYSNGFTNVNGTFTFCDTRGPGAARAIILSKTGRIRTSRTKADGRSPLQCD